ncbi:hypothetical protein GCM10009718_35070 [Isoptericola halotolerans]
MPWIPDPSCGDWVRAGLDPEDSDTWTIHVFVPRGFEAYARVLHPLRREADGVDVRWAQVAAAFGTTMSPTANLDRLCRRPWSGGEDVVTPQGEALEAPAEGVVPAAVLAALSEHLARHSTTPGSGVVGVWEGIGGLVSSGGRALYVARIPACWLRWLLVPWRRVVRAAGRAAFELRHRRWARVEFGPAPPDPDAPAPGTGILAADVAAGPRLDLPHRSHILFAAGIEQFTGRDWADDAPWLDDVDRSQRDPRTPAILWPEDRAWVAANDTDDAWTLVGGSRALVDALVADPALEALELTEGAVLEHAEPER